MTNEDLVYVRKLFKLNLITGPVLELGAGWGGLTAKPIIEEAGFKYIGTNIQAGPNIDIVADFERFEHMERFTSLGKFGSVFILNVLEHTFEPIRVLDNALSILRPGGTLVTITPCLWQIHDFPIDVYRILPSFYEEYGNRRNIELIPQVFDYIVQGPVRKHVDPEKKYFYPKPSTGIKRMYGRLIHRVFGTFGRGMYAVSYAAIGAVFKTKLST